MSKQDILEQVMQTPRELAIAQAGADTLGSFSQLPGTWKNEPGLEGRGWNMIALPFVSEGDPFNYRVLMNQYNEKLSFSLIDKGVPNRGILKALGENLDQAIVTLDYQQVIDQIAAEDNPDSGLAGSPKTIHHEPGLFLKMLNFTNNDHNIARLGSIPHGDTVLALGESKTINGAPTIPDVNVLPIGVQQDVDNNPYLAPYKHFHEAPFRGIFDVTDPSKLLRAATPSNVVKTTILSFSTTAETGGIHNIPFIVKHANASEMHSTFWIMETDEQEPDGTPVFIMQYMQVVMLDFFDRLDSEPGRIKWPHVSFNTMRRFPLDLT